MTESSVRLLIVVLLVAVNGFFAGAEVSLLSVRHSRLRMLAEEGNVGAQAALNLLSNPGRLLSVTQVGVTLASLGLGWAGEETIFGMLKGVFGSLGTGPFGWYIHALCFLLSFMIISFVHVVMGEVVPKNLAISKADRLAALTAPPLLLFARAMLPFVVVIERSSDAITRALHLKGGAHGSVHTADELKMIVTQSRGLGILPEAQEDMIHRVLDLDTVSVREIMVPRHDIVSIATDATLDEVLHTMIVQQHSRLPVHEGNTERITGLLHYKDLLPVWEERRNAIRTGRPSRAFRVDRLVRPVLFVPETKPVTQMFDEFRRGRSHLAMVVDEFGTVVGMLTVEDVLEQIVGQIEDEHDEKAVRRGNETDEVELDGTARIRDLESEYGIEIPPGPGFETLAGFLLFRLGDIPHTGASVEHEGRRFTVLEMERNRISRVRIEKIAAA